MGRRLAQKIKEVTNEVFAVIDGDFSSLYDLNARAKSRRDKDMMPVKLCERREKKEKANIKNVVLESLESKFFSIKYNE
jgi:nitrogenase subunit NifH